MQKTLEKIKVMEAFARGELIQVRGHEGAWIRASSPVWNWETTEYRVKPKKIEGWVNVYISGGVGYFYETAREAKKHAGENALRVAVHMREVAN